VFPSVQPVRLWRRADHGQSLDTFCAGKNFPCSSLDHSWSAGTNSLIPGDNGPLTDDTAGRIIGGKPDSFLEHTK